MKKTDEEKIKEYNLQVKRTEEFRFRLEEYYLWYRGQSDELVDFYLSETAQSLASNHEAFRNTLTYFWVVSSRERDVKKTHSGLPKEIVKLLTKILGTMTYSVNRYSLEVKDYLEDIVAQERLKEILKKCEFLKIYKNKQVPLTLVYGDGVYFPVIDKSLSNHPIIQYYDAKSCDYEYNGDLISSVTGKRYFYKGTEEFVLCERRGTVRRGGKNIATINYELFKLKPDSNEVLKVVSLDTLEETKDLMPYREFEMFDFMLAVPIFYDYDDTFQRGTSLFTGKVDLLDDLDQSLSQRSNSVRTSTPVEYLDADILDFDENGNPKKPKRFDRRYLINKHDRNAVGQVAKKVEISQPQINFSEYTSEALETTMSILSGIMSPATLGLDLARNTNQLAIREKEKVTMQTRDEIIELEMNALSDLFVMLLKMDDYMNDPTGSIGKDYHVNINYPEYASPTFEARLEALIGPFQSGMLSPEAMVDELWGESITESDKAREIEWMRSSRKSQVDATGEIEPFDFEGE